MNQAEMSAVEQSKKTLLRVAMDGIVYWLDNQTGDCYTYSDKPAKIGKAVRDAEDPKTLHIELRSDWKDIMKREMTKISA